MEVARLLLEKGANIEAKNKYVSKRICRYVLICVSVCLCVCLCVCILGLGLGLRFHLENIQRR